jgi:hypothetical protein
MTVKLARLQLMPESKERASIDCSAATAFSRMSIAAPTPRGAKAR